MRNLIIFLVFVDSMLTPVFAWASDYEITIDPSGPSLGGSMEIEMRKKYDYDPLNKYRGEIECDGSVRMRNMYGDVLRGTIDSDGYGRLYDLHGNIYRVRPR